MASVGIIGNSHVGAHVANALLAQGLVSELYLSDKDEVLCRAQVNDLLDAMSFYHKPARVYECDTRYEELAGCDVIVNAAGHVAAAAKDRDGENLMTPAETRTFVPRIMEAGFKGVWVSVANPNDVVATATGYSPMSINCWMLGEHGFSEFACWSHVRFGCLTPEEVEAQAGFEFDRPGLEEQATRGGYITMAGKHCTEYSIANGTVEIVKAVLNDSKIITPVSTLLDDVYGESGFYASLPCVVGAQGVEQVFVPDMPEAEVERWHQTCAHIRGNIDKIDWLRELL